MKRVAKLEKVGATLQVATLASLASGSAAAIVEHSPDYYDTDQFVPILFFCLAFNPLDVL